jgi:hypothetical protein
MLSTQNQIRFRGDSKEWRKKLQSASESHAIPKTQPFEGLWRSEKGSLYIGDGKEFICASVHSVEFIGWIGKVTIRDIEKSDGRWLGWHAFRDKQTGNLSEWVKIQLSIEQDKITKYFPSSVPGYLLFYGHIEFWYRVHHYQSRYIS